MSGPSTDFDVIMVGSGAGGLNAALGCPLAGKSVLVIEQPTVPGGWCHSFMLGGHHFSPGVHYIGGIGPGGQTRRFYEGLGVAKHIRSLELNPNGYDHVQIGQERFDFPKGVQRYKRAICERFPSQASGIDGYTTAIQAINAELHANMGRNRKRALLSLPMRAPNLVRWGMRPLKHLLHHHISDPLLHSVLSIQAGDHGLPASRAPAAMHASVAAHYFDGGYYP